MLNTSAPCSKCKYCCYNAMTRDDPNASAYCVLGHKLGTIGCGRFKHWEDKMEINELGVIYNEVLAEVIAEHGPTITRQARDDIYDIVSKTVIKMEEKKMGFDTEKFMDYITKSKHMCPEMKRDIKRGMRIAKGEEIVKVFIGGIYKSPRGIRMLVNTGRLSNPYYRIIVLDMNDSSMDHLVGHRIRQDFKNKEQVAEYMEEHDYKYLGQVAKDSINKLV